MTAVKSIDDVLNRCHLALQQSSCHRVRACASLQLLRLQELQSLSPQQSAQITALITELDLRKCDKPHLSVFSGFLALLRALTCVGIFLILAPVLLIASSLLILNPILRTFGLSNYQLPTEMIQLEIFRWGAFCLGLKIRVEGNDQVIKELNGSPAVFMYSHASNLDPIALGAISPIPLRFIGKRILFHIPILGWLFALYGHIPINRHDRESAIESLKSAARSVKVSKASIAISPEGTRSVSGHLQEFKKGPFHLAIHSHLPVVPVVIHDAYELMPPGQLLPRPGLITVRLLSPITPHHGTTPADLAVSIRTAMLSALADVPNPSSPIFHFRQVLITVLPIGLISLSIASMCAINCLL